MCNSFPLPVHTVLHTGTVLPATLTAALRLLRFQERSSFVMHGTPNTTNIVLWPDVLARANTMPTITVSVTSGRGSLCTVSRLAPTRPYGPGNEPLWSIAGKAQVWYTDGPRSYLLLVLSFYLASALLSLQKLWFMDTVL